MKITRLEIKRDVNGNKIARFHSATSKRGFSVQTLGNLPELHKLSVGESIPAHMDVACWIEFVEFIKTHGTKRQKSFFAS